MKNEFVTYEQALALKELGFDEMCFASIDNFSKLPYVPSKGGNYLNSKDYERGNSAACPLKQQVFRWFREKYELGHTICPYYFNTSITELQDVDDYPPQHEVYVSSPFTYEEAENACIDKLIEIAKQKDNGK